MIIMSVKMHQQKPLPNLKPESDDNGYIGLKPPRQRAVYIDTIVESSDGSKHEVCVPSGLINSVPKKWVWNDDKYRVAELIAHTGNISEVSRQTGYNLTTLNGWRYHPEFARYINSIIYETGAAIKDNRVIHMVALEDSIYQKLKAYLSGSIEITDKNIASLLNAYLALGKQIGIETGTYSEKSQIEQTVQADFNARIDANVKQETKVDWGFVLGLVKSIEEDGGGDD